MLIKEVQTYALVHRKARGPTGWPGSQPSQQGTEVSLGCQPCRSKPRGSGPGGAH